MSFSMRNVFFFLEHADLRIIAIIEEERGDLRITAIFLLEHVEERGWP